jgi:hypothetical protein
MDKEFAYIILLPTGSLLGMLGGYRWKWMRRYLLPAVIGGVIYWFTRDPELAIKTAITASVVFSFPYGENSSWVMRCFTAFTFGFFSLWLGFTAWQFAAPIVFIVGWVLSNHPKTKKFMQWKIVEGATFFASVLPVAHMLYYWQP